MRCTLSAAVARGHMRFQGSHEREGARRWRAPKLSRGRRLLSRISEMATQMEAMEVTIGELSAGGAAVEKQPEPAE